MTKTAVDTFSPEDLDHSPEWLEFVSKVRAAWSKRALMTTERHGQALFNALTWIRPDLAEHARGTLWDPFYRDENIFEFWVRIYDRFVLTLDD